MLPSCPTLPAAATLEPGAWAEQTYGGAARGDARRTWRVVSTMAAVAANPTASLPQQRRDPAARKATDRLRHEPGVPLPARWRRI